MKKSVCLLLVLLLASTLCACTGSELSEGVLDDMNLSEGCSQSIPVDGDFRLTVYFDSDWIKENRDYELGMNLNLGDERLFMGFGGHEGVGVYYGETILYHADGTTQRPDVDVDNTGSDKVVYDHSVRVQISRKDDTFVLIAQKAGFPGNKVLKSQEFVLDLPAIGNVELAGNNLKLTNIRWSLEPIFEGESIYANGEMTVLKLVITLVVSIAVIILMRKLFMPGLRKWANYKFSLIAAVFSAGCLVYGGILIISRFDLSLAESIVRFINNIYSGVESGLTVPLAGTVLANLIFIIVLMLLGLAPLMYAALIGERFRIMPIMLLTGVLGLVIMYPVICLAYYFIGALVDGVFQLLLVAGLFYVLGAAASKPDRNAQGQDVKVKGVFSSRDAKITEYMGEKYLTDKHGEYQRLTDNHDGTYSDSDGNRYRYKG